MTGPIGLHGGGEYVAGDEPFLDALLEAAIDAAPRSGGARGRRGPGRRRSRDRGRRPRPSDRHPADGRGRGQPDRAAATGRDAFDRRATATDRPARSRSPGSSTRRARPIRPTAARLAAADLIHLPGGDPDLIPRSWRAARRWRRSGPPRSAGRCRRRERRGDGSRRLDLDAGRRDPRPRASSAAWRSSPTTTTSGGPRGRPALDELAPGGIGYLGLDERTGVISIAGRRRWPRLAGRGRGRGLLVRPRRHRAAGRAPRRRPPADRPDVRSGRARSYARLTWRPRSPIDPGSPMVRGPPSRLPQGVPCHAHPPDRPS